MDRQMPVSLPVELLYAAGSLYPEIYKQIEKGEVVLTNETREHKTDRPQ